MDLIRKLFNLIQAIKYEIRLDEFNIRLTLIQTE